ncbi:microfibril-associated glycoprotein 4-like [Micropterus dolomieu]|uniref:microfibril-associated glycoprotein 4-like n=1 Tax=Micropterus dolomieu TaxID=147949 RepID=UPI001E8E4076|nr:microfibril-associated glycoprotein 4-like [Micropterus dolomieu]
MYYGALGRITSSFYRVVVVHRSWNKSFSARLSTSPRLDCGNVTEIRQQLITGKSSLVVLRFRAPPGIPAGHRPPATRGWSPWRISEKLGEASRTFPRLENIYQLTKQRKYELLVDMEDFEGKKVFARYSSFSIASECHGYKLSVSGFINGGAGDALNYHNGQKFTTFDKDQDSWPGNCARSYVGAFWYNDCHGTNPNGIYRWGSDNSFFAVGVEWSTWKGNNYSLKTISMKIRPVQ